MSPDTPGSAMLPPPKPIPARLRQFGTFRVSVGGTAYEIAGRSVYYRPKGRGTPLRRVKDKDVLAKVYRAADALLKARRTREAARNADSTDPIDPT